MAPRANSVASHMPRTRNLWVKHHVAREVTVRTLPTRASSLGMIFLSFARRIAPPPRPPPTVVGLRGIVLVSLICALLAGAAVAAHGQSEGALRGRIEHGKAQERALSGAVA